MSLVPKISRFTKLPELLKHKQEERDRRKKGRQDRDEHKRPPFSIEDELSLSPESLSELKVKSPEKKPHKSADIDDKKGGNIDLQA